MRNPLQDQLLKAGLAKKSQVAKAVRDQAKQRKAKGPVAEDAARIDARKLQEQRAERDRALAAERNVQARLHETLAQVRQIVESNKLPRDGDMAYGFDDDGVIKRLLVDAAQRTQLAKGVLVIARHGEGYELIPRAAADKVLARESSMIVLDHGSPEAEPASGDDDEYYRQFEVPDDLVW